MALAAVPALEREPDAALPAPAPVAPETGSAPSSAPAAEPPVLSARRSAQPGAAGRGGRVRAASGRSGSTMSASADAARFRRSWPGCPPLYYPPDAGCVEQAPDE
jgi:hypothetical protein